MLDFMCRHLSSGYVHTYSRPVALEYKRSRARWLDAILRLIPPTTAVEISRTVLGSLAATRVTDSSARHQAPSIFIPSVLLKDPLTTFLSVMAAAFSSISTPIPAGMDRDTILDCLRNHDIFFRITCPQLISYQLVSGVSNIGESVLYEVTDRRPIGETTYNLTLTNRDDGVDAKVEGRTAAGPMTIASKWRVVGNELQEEVVIESLLKSMIKCTIERNHPDHHRGFFAEAMKT